MPIAFALAILFAGHDDMMIAARRGSPLAIGYGDGEMYFGSDALALAPLTQRICYLEEGDWAGRRLGYHQNGTPAVSQPEYEVGPDGGRLPRRHFIKAVASGTVAGSAFLTSPPSLSGQNGLSGWQILDSFNRPNSWYHGDMWESLNPGFWKIENKRLRRRLRRRDLA